MFVDGLTSSASAYRLVKKDQTRLLAAFEKLPTYRREVDHYRANVGKVASVDALMKDRRLLTVALSAFQLESEIDKKALIRKIVTEDPSDPKALANRLADPRWQKFARAFHSLAADGGAAVRDPQAVAAVLGGYRTNEFEKAMGESKEAVREAMYFKRVAPGLDSVVKVLGDKVAAKVVRETLGLPLAFGALDVQQQKRMLAKKSFDPAKFADPAFLDKFVDRFLAVSDRANAASNPNPLLDLFSASSPGGVNLLA
jgi:hypothetical protein